MSLGTDTGTAGQSAPSRRWLAKVSAGLAGVSVVLHLAAAGEAEPGVAGWVMLGLAGTCLVCAVHLWRRPGAAAWLWLALTSLAMITTHVLLMRRMAETMAGMAAPMAMAGPRGTIMHWALAVAVLETAIALWALADAYINAPIPARCSPSADLRGPKGRLRSPHP